MAASTNTLSPKNQERLDTFAVEIAEERFGPFEEEGEGDWRLASNRSILIHPGAIVFNFATQLVQPRRARHASARSGHDARRRDEVRPQVAG